MSKFNATEEKGPKAVNFMGERAYSMNDRDTLVSLVMTTFLSDSYYMTENEIVRKIKELVEKVGYEFSAKLALYARKTGNMRSVSHLIASLVCRDEKRPEWLKRFYEDIVARPDDITEILCCYAAMNGIDMNGTLKKIPNSMKKGFRKALEKLSPYQIDKYKMNGKSLSLVDVVNLIHPKPTEGNAEAYRRLMHGESLDGTYDSLILEKEMTASCQDGEKTEEEKVLAKHYAIKAVLEKGMPIMNLLRNLRNIMIYAPDLIDLALDQMANEGKILRSRILPFRFASAYDVISKITIEDFRKDPKTGIEFEYDSPSMDEDTLKAVKGKVLECLERAMTISCRNVPELEGNCAILIDHSGSVRGDLGGSSTLSPMSSVKTAMIGNLFGSIMAYRQKNVYIGMFGDNLIPVKMNRDCGILKFNADSYYEGRRCGGATENGIYEFMRNAISERKSIDNLIIFSDMEIGDGGMGGWDMSSRTGGVRFHELFAEFRKINPDCLTVCCNIRGGGGTTVFNPNLRILNISGWSNSIFDTISMYKGEKLRGMVEEIEKISLNGQQNRV